VTHDSGFSWDAQIGILTVMYIILMPFGALQECDNWHIGQHVGRRWKVHGCHGGMVNLHYYQPQHPSENNTYIASLKTEMQLVLYSNINSISLHYKPIITMQCYSLYWSKVLDDSIGHWSCYSHLQIMWNPCHLINNINTHCHWGHFTHISMTTQATDTTPMLLDLKI